MALIIPSLTVIILWVMKALICYCAHKAINMFCRTYEIELIRNKDKIDGVIHSKLFGIWFNKQVVLTNIQSAQLALTTAEYDSENEHYIIHILCDQGLISTGQTLSDNQIRVDALNIALSNLKRTGYRANLSLSPPNIKLRIIMVFLGIMLMVGLYVAFSPQA